jgi:cytochrome c oxidase subunit 2
MRLSFPARYLCLAIATAIIFCDLPRSAVADSSIDIAVKNWSFTPATIDTHVGRPTVLRFTDSEGVHGVESADIGLAKTVIVPNKVTEATFTPKTAGTFGVHCAVICGEGHDKMLLTVRVEP